LKEARQELRHAVKFYRSVRQELGDDFLAKVEKGVELIRDHPRAWQEGSHGTKRYLLNRFPYGIVYKQFGNTILIVAITHLHRLPDYWHDRIEP
jgi:Plasmid stabilisation system protein.